MSTVTVLPSEIPVVVPRTMTSSSSDALTLLSPSKVALIAMVAEASYVTVLFLVALAVLPAKSVTETEISIFPS